MMRSCSVAVKSNMRVYKEQTRVSQYFNLHAWAPPAAVSGWVDERISRDLMWIKIVVWNYLNKHIMWLFSHFICSFYQLYFNCNNYSIKFLNWLFSTITKFSFETSPRGPRTMWRHKWLCDIMNVMHSNCCMLPMQDTATSHEYAR